MERGHFEQEALNRAGALAEGGVAELVRIGVDAGGGADSRAPRLNTSLHTYHVGHDVGIPLNMMLEFLRIKNQE